MKFKAIFLICLILAGTILGVYHNFIQEDSPLIMEEENENTPKFMKNGEWKKIVFGNETEREDAILNG